MKFPTQQTDEVKKWVVKQVENISDADPDVLADYVLALLKSDIADEEIRLQMVENLPDFLREHTKKFVDEVFAKYATKPAPAALPRLHSAPVSPVYSPSESTLPIESYQGETTREGTRVGNGGPRQQRKRSYHEYNGQDQQQNGTERSRKSTRPERGSKEKIALSRSQYPSPAFPSAPFHTLPFSNLPRPPTPPPGLPAFDLSNPMSSFMAMQAMFPNITRAPKHNRQRCRDYDTKGFCVRGAACPYDHGNDHLVAPGESEYDPNNAIIDTNGRSSVHSKNRSSQSEVTPRKSNRAVFSDLKVPKDRTLTAIVVEQIPEEHFHEETVRDFFSQFGKITEVTMHAYKHLAIVNYENRNAAQRAFESPKAIFENRFVKVYWYRPDLDDKAGINGRISKERSSSEAGSRQLLALSTEEDLEVYRREQEEKQKVHERRQAAMKRVAEAKQALAQQQEEMTRHNEEKATLIAKLASKGVLLPADGTEEEVPTETMALREQLARLEAEAKSMGIDPDAPIEEYSYSFRGRGRGRGFNSRGGYYVRSRGRGNAPYDFGRGYHNGSPYVRGRSSAVRKLDNRPRNIAVSGVEFDAKKDEMLRAYLISVGEFDGVERHPERPDSMIVSFKERWQAEQVMKGGTEIPGVGKVTLSWIASVLPATTEPVTMDDDENMAEALNETNGKAHDTQDDTHHEQELNLDVADEDDWGGIS